MLTIIGFLAGVFVGWNFPQPAFAKDLQAKIAGYVNRIWTK